MSLASALSTYLTVNALVVVAYLGLKLWHWLSVKFKFESSSKSQLNLHYGTLLVLFATTLSLPLLPKPDFFRPTAKVWTAESIKSFPSELNFVDKGGFLSVSTPNGNLTVNADNVSSGLTVLALIVFILGLLRIAKDLRSLFEIRKNSYPVRKIGAVTIFVNDFVTVPFSTWLPTRADVVIPTPLLSKPLDFKMAIAHEIQHHRQHDTKWVYGLWALKLICVANPFTYLWSRTISEIQEFACDETLVDQNKVESHQYTRCLIEVAETASTQKYEPVCATGLIFLRERNILKRRIEKMLHRTKTQNGKSASLLAGLVIACLMSGVAFASKGFVQDRRVSMQEAQRIAIKTQNSEFPIVVNDLVLKQLNRYVGTPEGRQFMKSALQRMLNYEKSIQAKLAEYKVPAELIAIPIVESGYQNLPQGNQKGWGAGLWMFIPSTAQNFGLRVDNVVDERLNEDLLTDAAMRLLKAGQLQFKDWQLSVLAYNIGGNKTQKAIAETGSRDAWTIVRAGYENDTDYLAKVMAAILIMKNPETVE